MPLVLQIQTKWQTRLAIDCARQDEASRSSILNWLMGEDRERWETLEPPQLQIIERGMEYRLQILCQRYLGLSPTLAYKHLMQRLGGLVVLREKIRSWLAQSQERQRTIVDVVQEVIQEMLQRDRYILQQLAWIGECTRNARLRDALLFATVEEYCLRPVQSKPLIACRFVNYLRRSQTGGMTKIPQGEWLKFVSDEVICDDDAGLSRFDLQAQDDYLQQQAEAETQVLRDRVIGEFRAHLVEKIGAQAGIWLDLYLQGKPPESIATTLEMNIKQIYRLKQTINYHAIKVFAMKSQPELVSQWLRISLQEHNFGLTPNQWEKLDASLDFKQLQILIGLKSGLSVQTISQNLNLKTDRVVSEWSRINAIAQKMRTA
ncbi:hypothetical protein C7B77_04405 [Chamaesiphon polymorphus CCALA 037]|uniref:HetZ-related protein 2 n=1 Tax=Chamaesiphon polymorphus CCALA 037 TaxID=2107692 RepID=A0A2T1GL11_9CYAN|nr:hypothetical protein C7B77_04405 [Chamaesiphon polymorphus CCALA 037]